MKHAPRVSSIRTRIKTVFSEVLDTSFHLREYLPLEQGLRLLLIYVDYSHITSLREYLPLEQGLRHLITSSIDEALNRLREYLPLEQGLRLL